MPLVFKEELAQDIEWKDPGVIYEFPDGWKILYLKTPEDLTTLGRTMVHCSWEPYHHYWALEVKLTYFFALVDEKGHPHSSIHAKHASWVGKRHPQDEVKSFWLGGSTAYDNPATRATNPRPFSDVYRCPLPNSGNIPHGIDTPVWEAFVQAHKALGDNYRKNVAGIKIVGRRVKFDGKYLVILSASGRGGSEVYQKHLGEWLNDLGKKKVA